MSWPRGMFVGAMVAAIAIACSSFDEPPATPDDGDGGVGNGDGGPNDDGTAGDANAGGDAPVDGGCPLAPAPSGCANAVIQKLDFTVNDLPPVGWEDDIVNGTLKRVAEPGYCSPGFLRAKTDIPNDAGANGEAQIVRTLTGSFRTARLAFAFRGPTPISGGYANIGCLLLLRPSETSTPRSQVRMTLESTKLTWGGNIRIADGGLGTAPPPLVLDQVFDTSAANWHTVDAQFVISDNNVSVSTIYDGTPLAELVVPLLAPAGRADIECGINYSDEESTSYTHDIDDVFVELCP